MSQIMSQIMIQITYYHHDEENEEEGTYVAELPGKYDVCYKCEGHGMHLSRAIAEHCYTQEEFEESFSNDEEKEEYFKRGGMHDITCTVCAGKRVVLVVDEARCTTTEQKEILATYKSHVASAEADRKHHGRTSHLLLSLTPRLK